MMMIYIGNAQARKEMEKINEDIKNLEKFVHHVSSYHKFNRCGFVVSSGILVQFKPVNLTHSHTLGSEVIWAVSPTEY